MPSEEALSDDELLTQAHELREEAHLLLYEKGLLGVVESAGPARVIGSFPLDLMTWRDLDISVQLRDKDDIPGFFEIGRRIIDRFCVTKMTYNNPVLRPDLPYDRGFYWGIHMLHSEHAWKVDLWGYGEDDYQSWDEKTVMRLGRGER